MHSLLRALSLAAPAICLVVFAAGASRSLAAELTAFVSSHCLDCHQGGDAAAGFDLSALRSIESESESESKSADAETIRRWVQVFDRVSTGEMPPADAEQPSDEARNRFSATVRQRLIVAESARRDVVLRRLNRNEYQNTVRDLFQIDTDVAVMLPADNVTEGFDNVGEGLAMSAEAAGAYLRAADHVLDVVFGPEREPKQIRHETNLLDQKTHDGKPALERQIGKMFRRTPDGLVIFQSGYCPTNLVNFARLRAPAGTYRGKLKVRAIQSDEPVTLRIYGGDTIVGRRERHLVGYYDVPPGDWTTIEFTDKLVEPNGTFQPKCYGTRDTRKDADTYPEPGIEIGDIVIQGPLEAWPPPSRRRLLGDIDVDAAGAAELRELIARWLPRVFRRPIREDEAAVYEALGAAALEQGRSFEDAVRLAMKAMLCSPEFLYLDEPAQTDRDDRVTPMALASRLSYFLWSSMPDNALFAAAADGSLLESQVLRREVERMLADPKADAFTENFVGQWLDLRDINFTTPDQKLYPDFDELLQISMVQETHAFFRHQLETDGSIMQFVDCDFTFLNQRLAEHYGISNVTGQRMRRVALPADSVRGGVLTMASVLKVTANGTTTSPVTRGAWVLEKIQGERIPPPPSNVPAVEPDIRGAVTLREQLAKHRNDASCAVCHDRLDPPGFALENFDVIGGWRDNYRTLGEGPRPKHSQDPHTFAWIRWRIGPRVDATGQTADGKPFDDMREFKRLLLEDEEGLVLGLARQLATYSLGRRMGFADRGELNQLVAKTRADGGGMRSLVHRLVQSSLFQRP